MVTDDNDSVKFIKFGSDDGPNISPRELESAFKQIEDLGERLAYDGKKWAMMVNILAPMFAIKHEFEVVQHLKKVEGNDDAKGKD